MTLSLPLPALAAGRSAARRLRPALSALALAALAACGSLPSTGEPIVPPAHFKEQRAASAEPGGAEAPVRADGAWWRSFEDPLLDRLVEQSLQANDSIRQAAARLGQARALAGQAASERAPQFGLQAGADRQAGIDRTPDGRPGTLLRAGLGVSYEIDLFGRLSQASRAASLDAAAAESLLQDARRLVQAEVAQTYFALRAADAERALMRDTVAAYRDTRRLTESRRRAGDLAPLDLARVDAELAATESEALAVDRQRALLEHALAVLTGAPPAAFDVAQAEWHGALPRIPAGLPSTLLERRPDILAAAQRMQAAQARVGVAQAAWFPQLSLTAAGGFASGELGQLLRASAQSWGVGALASLPLFDGGRRASALQGASAQLDGAVADYRGQVLVALREVEDQLASLRLLGEQAEAQSRAVRSAGEATRLSDARYRNGYVSQLDLLDARRSELRNRRQALQVRAGQYAATVGLIRALGGGWGPVEGRAAPTVADGAASRPRL